MALSILHRATGIVLSLGLVLLVAWLLAAASGPDAYAAFAGFAGHGLVQVALAGWTVAFLYHLANGIRHLAWDAGFGFEKPQARRSALLVIIGVIVLAALLLPLLFLGGRS
jgi:succinate dehydrogenase / fumarate reductase cytochrome b subunit